MKLKQIIGFRFRKMRKEKPMVSCMMERKSLLIKKQKGQDVAVNEETISESQLPIIKV